MSTSYYGHAPLSYKTPSFPSLYWPIRTPVGEARYLYHFEDIWRFTLCWTLITMGGSHFLAAIWAVLMQFTSALHRRAYLDSGPGRALSAKNRRLFGENPIRQTVGWVWSIPLIYLVISMAEAFVAGSVVGVILGVMYETGYFRMSTWTPLFWGVINMMMMVVASFRVQGGM